MKNVLIEYKRWGFRHTHKVRVPENWHEMEPYQFLAACKLYMKEISGMGFVLEFFKLPVNVFGAMDEYTIYKLVEMVEFVQDCRQPHNAFFMEKLPNTKLFAPKEKLKDMSLQQFMTADTYYSRYVISNDELFLNLFVAALYLPRNTVFVREINYEIPELMKKMPVLLDMQQSMVAVKKLTKECRFAVFMNFLLIKNWLGGLFPYLFPKGSDSENVKIKSQQVVNWLDIFDSFVGDNVAEMKKYQVMNCMDAFRIMNRRIKEQDKLKR